MKLERGQLVEAWFGLNFSAGGRWGVAIIVKEAHTGTGQDHLRGWFEVLRHDGMVIIHGNNIELTNEI